MKQSSESTEKPTSSYSDFGQQSNPRVYRIRESKDHSLLPQSISVPRRSERKLKRQHRSSQSWAKHFTCESEPRTSLPLPSEIADWGRTILSRQRQNRRRRESLLVVDSDACKEAHRFCEAQYLHDVLEEYSDMEKPSIDRLLPPSDSSDTADLTLKELAGLVLNLCSIRDNQPCLTDV